ncbi:MAG: HNH endonuclease signature motif containing protein [Coprobacillaceae bacterium]
MKNTLPNLNNHLFEQRKDMERIYVKRSTRQDKARQTTFKKGNIPLSKKPIGSEYIDKDGYLYIKTKDTGKRLGRTGMWQAYHILVWEQYNGELPKGHIVIFLDQDKSNFSIDN